MGLHKRGRKPFVFCGRRRYNGKKFAARFSARMAADHTAKTDPALHEGAGSVSGFGTVYSAEAYIGPEVRKLPGSGRRGAGRRDAAARPQGGRAFGACGAKASAPPSVYALPPYHGGPYLYANQVPFAQKRGSSQPLSFTLVPYQRNTPPGTARPWCRYTAPWHGRCCSRPLRMPGRWDPVCGSLPAQTPSGSPPYP